VETDSINDMLSSVSFLAEGGVIPFYGAIKSIESCVTHSPGRLSQVVIAIESKYEFHVKVASGYILVR
jgi:hypothetical protein